MTPLDPRSLSKTCGTYNQVDRSRQYTKADSPELLKSLNDAWSKIRLLEAAGLRKDSAISKLHARLGREWVGYLVSAAVAALTALAWEIGLTIAPLVWAWMRGI